MSSFAIVEMKKISLKEAIDMALKTNPQLKIARLDYDIKKNEIKIANKLQNPGLGAFQNLGTAGKTQTQMVGADFVVEILKRGPRKKTAISKSQSAFNNQKFLEYKLILEIKKAYFDLLLKKSNLKIVLEQQELSRQLYEQEEKEAKVDKISQTEVLQAKINLNRAIMYSNIAKSEVISAQNRFNTVINSYSIDYDTFDEGLSVDYKKLLTYEPDSKLPDFADIKKYTLSNRYDFLALQKEVEAKQNNLIEVKRQAIPDLELQAGWQYIPRGHSDTKKLENGSYIGANIVNIPLLYRYQPEIKNAELEIEQAQLRYEDLKIDIIRNITDAWEKYTIARNNLNYYNKELLSNSKELLDASYKSLSKKETDLTSFLVSKKTYLEIMLGYNQALAEYYISYAELICEMNSDSLIIEKI